MAFELPLIVGHEVIGIYRGQKCVMDINASHFARGIKSDCPWCQSVWTHSQCPERITLGIDRLPGGFAPWLLVPKNALIPIGDLPLNLAVITEPFAAARHVLIILLIYIGRSYDSTSPRRNSCCFRSKTSRLISACCFSFMEKIYRN